MKRLMTIKTSTGMMYLNVNIKKLEKNDLMEIDSVEDLKKVEAYLGSQLD